MSYTRHFGDSDMLFSLWNKEKCVSLPQVLKYQEIHVTEKRNMNYHFEWLLYETSMKKNTKSLINRTQTKTRTVKKQTITENVPNLKQILHNTFTKLGYVLSKMHECAINCLTDDRVTNSLPLLYFSLM